jgi:glycogen debranching enzyme
MDAKIGDWVVTPRLGKPVEIQALWYNALRVMEHFAEIFGYESERQHYSDLAWRAQSSFLSLFWNESQRCLYDVVGGNFRDPAIRPNQIFAVSLPHRMLSSAQEKCVVEAVQRCLLTPYGLRSLAPSDPAYRGRYSGDPRTRDSAYHQGTVWPWLLGPFLRAYLTVNGHSEAARKQAYDWMGELRRYIADEGTDQLPEVFDGDAPHRPGGCIAQAWSVAALLHTCVQDFETQRFPKPDSMFAAAAD